ncbi:Nucleoporin nup85 [Tieghemiomyces parasiticus]|uniref:Nuclear pore complex protein Nup85 n=1 Tax=Tieghemiomyces parasiticus TaxID=78921 RepID=A0A9W7ZS18_9FUNG|nr:Nucleoporin nup85 [Tieghemiomyces parasiticus]
MATVATNECLSQSGLSRRLIDPRRNPTPVGRDQPPASDVFATRLFSIPSSRRTFLNESHAAFGAIQDVYLDYVGSLQRMGRDPRGATLPQENSRRLSKMYKDSIYRQVTSFSQRLAVGDPHSTVGEEDLNQDNVSRPSTADEDECDRLSQCAVAWSLLEILYTPSTEGRSFVDEYLSWLNRNFPRPSVAEGQEIAQTNPIASHPRFWPYVVDLVLQGHTTLILEILRQVKPLDLITSYDGIDESAQLDLVANGDKRVTQIQLALSTAAHLIETLPQRRAHASSAEFLMRWNEWKTLAERWAVKSLPTEAEPLRAVFQILSGNAKAINQHSVSWQQSLGAILFYKAPTTPADQATEFLYDCAHLPRDFHYELTGEEEEDISLSTDDEEEPDVGMDDEQDKDESAKDSSMDEESGLESEPSSITSDQSSRNVTRPEELASPLDRTLLALIQFDQASVIRYSQQIDIWLVTHLADFLDKLGYLDEVSASVHNNIRDFFVFAYGESLITSAHYWQLGVYYLSSCPGSGMAAIEMYLTRLPLDTERKIRKVLALLQSYGLDYAYQTVCRTVARRHLDDGHYGTAISYYVQAAEPRRVAHIAELLLLDYIRTGSQAAYQTVIDNLATQVEFSEKLQFLSEYRDFHELRRTGAYRSAAQLVVKLINHKIAPKRFWLMLIFDALPLLEGNDVVFNAHETSELMNGLEEITASHLRDEYLGVDAPLWTRLMGEEVSVDQKLAVIRTALVRNLARAVLFMS